MSLINLEPVKEAVLDYKKSAGSDTTSQQGYKRLCLRRFIRPFGPSKTPKDHVFEVYLNYNLQFRFGK